MKQMKRTPGLYKPTNLTFDVNKLEAYSYVWWKFVGVIEGNLIFNNHRYSMTTAKHQFKVAQLMQSLGIKEELRLPVPRGLQCYDNLAEMILDAEEHLCGQYLEQELKKQERYERVKAKRQATQALVTHAAHEGHAQQLTVLKLLQP